MATNLRRCTWITVEGVLPLVTIARRQMGRWCSERDSENWSVSADSGKPRRFKAMVGDLRLANIFCVAHQHKLCGSSWWITISQNASYLTFFFHSSMCLHRFVKLVTRQSARFDNNDSEPKSQVRLLKFPEEN